MTFFHRFNVPVQTGAETNLEHEKLLFLYPTRLKRQVTSWENNTKQIYGFT